MSDFTNNSISDTADLDTMSGRSFEDNSDRATVPSDSFIIAMLAGFAGAVHSGYNKGSSSQASLAGRTLAPIYTLARPDDSKIPA